MGKLFQRILSTVTAFTMLLCVSSSSIQVFTNEIEAYAADSKVIYGDVNGDKKVNIFDLSLIKKEILNPGTSIDLIAADVNGDGIVDSKDAREVQQFLLCRNYSFSATIRTDLESIDCTIVTKDQPIETSLTAEMAEKTKELGSAVAVYNYLYNNMQSQFYYGSRKGAIGTFEQGGGNDTDLSSLLIAMLRYLGYEANYVTTVVGFTESELLSWTNTDSIDVAIAIYAAQGRSHDIYTSGNTKYYRCDYKYVQLIDNGKTYYLDVCFKNYENQKTVYDAIDSSYSISSNAKTILDNTDINLLSKEIFKSQSAVSKLENNSYAFNSRKIVQKSIKSLPTGNPHSYDIEPTVSESVTDDESDIVKIGFSTNNQKSYRVAELYNKNIIVSYEVSSDTKEWKEIFIGLDTSSIFNLPTSLMGQSMSVTPILKIDGVTVLSGNPLNIGSKQTLYITAQTGGTTQTYEESLTAGEMCSIVFDMGQISANELKNAYTTTLQKTEAINQKNKFTSDMSDSDLSENNVYNPDYLGNLLRLTGVMYFAQLDIVAHAMAEKNNIHNESKLRFGVFGFKPSVYVPSNIQTVDGKDGIQKYGEYFVDVLSNDINYVSKSNNSDVALATSFNVGMMSSALESAVLEQVLDVQGISTMTIFQNATENNIPLVTVTSLEQVSTLKLSDSDDIARIQSVINAGGTVIVPESDVTIGSWKGIGYIISNKDGTQYYKTSGGYNGGITFDPVTLGYVVSVGFDMLMISESITAICGILAGMATLAVAPVAVYLLAVVTVELLVFEIVHQSDRYYEYLRYGSDTAAAQIQISSVTTIVAWGLGACFNYGTEQIIISKLSKEYGKSVINNVQNFGFTISEINAKIKIFESYGISKTTIDILLKDSKSMFLDNNILAVISKSGTFSDDLAHLILINGDDFANIAIETFSKEGIVGIQSLIETFGDSHFVWSRIIATAQNMEATNIPATFQVKLKSDYINPKSGTRVLWTNSNATEHMGDYVARFGKESWSIKLRSQLVLQSYVNSLDLAISQISSKPPGRYENLKFGIWTLGIDTTDGAVFHAFMN